MAQERRNNPRHSREESAAPQRRSSRRRGSSGRAASFAVLYVVGVIGASVLLACLGWIAANDVLALNKEEKTVTITITEDESFGDVVNRLKDEGLIEYKWLFRLFAAFTGGDDKVTMGTYTLNTDMDYRGLVANMSVSSSTRQTVDVTIPEGYTIDQIFALLEEQGVSTVEKLQEMAADWPYKWEWLPDIPLGDYHRLEGYLMPSTYEFYTPHDPVYAINKLLVYFDSMVTDDIRAQVEETGYSLREILTIASMIERETDGSDREEIASVIYNRLEHPEGETVGLLQIDATLAYINGGKVPTEADKAIDSPYNTYMYKGLPPAPIANPGMEAIMAALEPADTSYFYYALGDDNLHHFFNTYDQLQSFLNSQERYK